MIRDTAHARLFASALAGLCTLAGAQFQSVVDSPHNLSAFGPGTIRATSESQVCIFCHAPHNSSPVKPLWNRAMPVDAYTIYTSRSLDAKPGQPTGTSKMCLSCHDGTIALGAVFSQPTPISMVGGVTTMPQGRGLIGTDLRDDHPISFPYDSSLAAADPKLRQPAALPHAIRLDGNGELQCTTCHDAHNNVHGSFLVMSNFASQLCMQCHTMGSTTVPAHQDCASCHVAHGSPSGPYLLRAPTIAETCLACHSGQPGSPNIAADLARPYTHETFSPVDPPDPQNRHAACTDCHEAHTMTSSVALAPNVPGNFGMIDGVSASGSPLQIARHEYEVCFKCHANNNPVPRRVARQAPSNNTRLQFDPSAISFHPVEVPGRNTFVPSLKPGWNESSLVRCADCHGSHTAGPGAASGIHGSVHPGLLVANYSTADFTNESAHAYALCYSCHDRNSILNNESFPLHRQHIVEQRTSCATCHDAHGIASIQGSPTRNSHLINFDTSVVRPLPGTGRMEFIDRGVLSGTCYLSCHGVNHAPAEYP